MSTIARNKRLREARRDASWDAEAATRYYRAALDFHVAVSVAQCRGSPEGNPGGPLRPENGSPECRESARLGMVANWREALVRQLLTPAPDAAAVSWKRAALVAGKWRHTDTTGEQIEQAIAEDVAFLAAHPVRKSDSEAMPRRREFKEAMCRRIREIAASRDLSDEEIKPALTLRHHEIVIHRKAWRERLVAVRGARAHFQNRLVMWQ